MHVSFGGFILDRATRQLLRGGKERHLEPKAFEMLELLLARRPAAVAKTEIQEFLWPATFVSESSLTRLVAQIRRALGDRRQRPRFVRTVHGFGYASSGDASDDSAKEAHVRRPVIQVIWEERAYTLELGENVLGPARLPSILSEGLDPDGVRAAARSRIALPRRLPPAEGHRMRSSFQPCHYPRARVLAPTRCFRLWRPEAWARSSAREILGSTATWRSRLSPPGARVARKACAASS